MWTWHWWFFIIAIIPSAIFVAFIPAGQRMRRRLKGVKPSSEMFGIGFAGLMFAAIATVIVGFIF